MSVWVQDNIWLNRRKGFRKLCEAELGVAIEVEPSHNSGKLMFDWLMTDTFKEASERDLVNDPMILEVNCLKGPSNAETVEFFQV